MQEWKVLHLFLNFKLFILSYLPCLGAIEISGLKASSCCRAGRFYIAVEGWDQIEVQAGAAKEEYDHR